MAAPLDDIKVITIESWMAAPSASAILADLGADVIKVEPLTGDPMRGLSRPAKVEAPGNGRTGLRGAAKGYPGRAQRPEHPPGGKRCQGSFRQLRRVVSLTERDQACPAGEGVFRSEPGPKGALSSLKAVSGVARKGDNGRREQRRWRGAGKSRPCQAHGRATLPPVRLNPL